MNKIKYILSFILVLFVMQSMDVLSATKKCNQPELYGLSLDEVYSMLQQSAPKSPDQEEIDPGADSNEHTPSPNLGFIPSGRAPYFDPQLDKAIDYFRESESNSLGDKKIEL